MKSLLALMLLISSPSFAFVGFSRESCAATKQEAANMREEAATGEVNADTEWSANMDCGGHIPWNESDEVLSAYWLKCANTLDQIYKDNCDLP